CSRRARFSNPSRGHRSAARWPLTLVGTLLLTLPPTPDAGPIQIDASFADGHVSTPLLLLDEADLAAAEDLAAPSLITDLPPDEARHRVRAMLAFVDADLEIGA